MPRIKQKICVPEITGISDKASCAILICKEFNAPGSNLGIKRQVWEKN